MRLTGIARGNLLGLNTVRERARTQGGVSGELTLHRRHICEKVRRLAPREGCCESHPTNKVWLWLCAVSCTECGAPVSTTLVFNGSVLDVPGMMWDWFGEDARVCD